MPQFIAANLFGAEEKIGKIAIDLSFLVESDDFREREREKESGTYNAIAVKPSNGIDPHIIPIKMPNTCRDQ